MKIREIVETLNATVYSCPDMMEEEVITACGSDMMSDVLAYYKTRGMLLTGLLNLQTIRTADMMDVKCIAFVRGKVPDEAIVALAEQRGIVTMSTEMGMFGACGELYAKGLMTSTKHGERHE